MIRYGLAHEMPECLRVIRLREMAELVDDDIVGERRRQKRDFVIKIEITSARTAPPERPLIFDADFVKSQSVCLIEMRDARVR